jgi:hypothetical protein
LTVIGGKFTTLQARLIDDSVPRKLNEIFFRLEASAKPQRTVVRLLLKAVMKIYLNECLKTANNNKKSRYKFLSIVVIKRGKNVPQKEKNNEKSRHIVRLSLRGHELFFGKLIFIFRGLFFLFCFDIFLLNDICLSALAD